MEHRHLDADTLEHLLVLDRTARQNEQLFHLLAVCPRCREVGGWLLELHQANALPPVFGLLDATLARSRAEASQLLEALLPLDPDERLDRLHADTRFASWGLCELLVRKSCQTAAQQPSEAIHLADLAVHAADRIAEGDLYEESGSTSFEASPGPPSATPDESQATSSEPSAASTWRTPGGKRAPSGPKTLWAMNRSSWT